MTDTETLEQIVIAYKQLTDTQRLKLMSNFHILSLPEMLKYIISLKETT